MRGEFGVDVAELVTRKLAPVVRHVHAPVLDVRVRLTRRQHHPGGHPVELEVTMDVNGTPVRAEASARGVLDAVDRVVTRLVRQLEER